MTPPRTLHILLVEDEPGDVGLMRMALKRSGFPLGLYCIEDGLLALDCLRQQGERFRHAPRPDLILLDLKMPGQGGLETLRAIKQNDDLRAIPVVVMTASALEADVAAAYQLGAAGFVQKPVDLNDFMAAIQTLGEYWFALVRLPAKA